MDYNKLMMELESCLGLETPAMESIKGKGQEKVAFEGYDEVEKELAAELGVEVPAKGGSNDLQKNKNYLVVYVDQSGSNLNNPKLMEKVKGLAPYQVFYFSGEVSADRNGDLGMGTNYRAVSDHIKKNGFDNVVVLTDEDIDLDPDGEELKSLPGIKIIKDLDEMAGFEAATKTKEEDITFLDEEETSEAMVEPNPEEEPDPKEIFKEQVKTFFNSLDMEPEEAMKVINEVMAEALDCGECKTEEGEEGGELDIQSLDEISTAEEGCSKEPAEEGCGKKEEAKEEKKEEPVSEEEGSAFEEFSAKMLNRYKSLAAKEGFGSKSKVANEGIGEISICESAIDRTSCEFNYSGENLRKMVKEAIEKGII